VAIQGQLLIQRLKQPLPCQISAAEDKQYYQAVTSMLTLCMLQLLQIFVSMQRTAALSMSPVTWRSRCHLRIGDAGSRELSLAPMAVTLNPEKKCADKRHTQDLIKES
jgi:hypothetical protein